MKKSTRAVLYCTKVLDNGVRDSFTVVVPISEKDVIKKVYEGRGYSVAVV